MSLASTPPSILVVDDSLTVRMDLCEAFAAAGFHAVPAATLAEARAALAADHIALVVLDVVLPDGDGVDFLAELRASPRAELPVMLLSSEAEVQNRVRGLRTGADEYVGKPYELGFIVARARELARAHAPAAGAQKPLVLVIDDSQTLREQLRGVLEDDGFDVALAVSGEEGLHKAATLRPAGMLIDSQLPGIDGATVIRRVRLDAALRDTPCILLTGTDEEGAELRALDAGADAFVRKDEDMPVLLARLHASLRGVHGRAAAAELPSLMGPKRILAVDDSPTYLHEVSSALRGEGYDVVMARSGEEALDLLAVQAVDCILLDLEMPGLGGLETCRSIKGAAPLRDVPLIFLTSRDDRVSMMDGLAAGADDYLSKTSDLEVVRARVRAQLRRRQSEEENRRFRDHIMKMQLDAAEARAARELADTRALLVAQLERKNRELEAFSYSVSHDLRAPLRSIDGFSQLLVEELGDKLGPDARNYLDRTRAAVKRMGALIDDLLELSRVGRAELRRVPVDLSALAQDVLADLAKATPRPTLQLRVQDGLDAKGDPGLLRVVLVNLLGNAWKFTGKKDEASIDFGVSAAAGAAASGGSGPIGTDGPVYFVRDNGAGFDPRYAAKLFAPFQRLHSDKEFPGTGIGLSIVQRILERHGGRIWAESQLGEGTTFYFTVP
jgi:two-component system NtrC family sensor kinase